MDTADRPGALGARYQRPYAVPERLDLLRGPLSGTVRLPPHLDWSGNAVYDLDAPGRVIDLYRAVLIEAADPQDLYAYLDDRILLRLWALLWLPFQLRKAWEQRFPVLGGRYAGERLLELAAEADSGFDRLLFADALGALTQITDAAFAEYRADPGMIGNHGTRDAQLTRTRPRVVNMARAG